MAWKKDVRWNLKSRQQLLWEIEKFASVDPVFRDRQKEVWKEELEDIERKRTELLLEHQKMQKKSQKLQIQWNKQKNHHKIARDSEEEMQTLNKEMEEKGS